MPVPKFNANVGLKRIGSNVNPTQADFTRSVRNQIQGIVNEYTRLMEYLEVSSPQILKEALEPTFALSQSYVPYDTGALHDSGYLEVQFTRGRSQVEIGYGKGGYPEYAVFVHEMPDIPHKPPTRSKWLESALEEDWPNVLDRLVANYKGASGV